MTFAELLILAVIASVIYYFLKPIQKRLEGMLYKYFRSKQKNPNRPVVDITDYTKKKGPDQ